MFRYIVLLLLPLPFTACEDGAGDRSDPAEGADDTARTTSFAPAAPPATPPSVYDASPPDGHLRPYYHFTPPAGWMNDPNGLVYHAGEYHLFYQHYPDDNVWGPMHWGHAVSTDLINWEHLPIALSPDSLGYIFSGSAVVDHGNTSGLGTVAEPPLVAVFTYHDMAAEQAGRTDYESQAIAYSTDRGRTWTKYAGNPVVANRGGKDFRDPKVIRDPANEQWVMVLAAGDRVQFFTSPDLKNWTYRSDFGQGAPNHAGVWECPELLAARNETTGETNWLLLVSINSGGANGGSGTMYFTGHWDGRSFQPFGAPPASPTDSVKWVDYGRDNYAGVTFNNAPNGRHVFLGWMSNWHYARDVPTTSWRSALTLPRELSLVDNDFGTRLHQQPVEELQRLRGQAMPLEMPRLLDGVTTVDLRQLKSDGAYEIDFTVDLADSDAEQLYVTLGTARGDRFYRFGYRRKPGVGNAFFTDRRQSGPVAFNDRFAPDRLTVAPRWSDESTLRFHVYIDRTSAEIFCDAGEPVLTDIFFPEEPYTILSFGVKGSVGKGMPEGWRLVEGHIWGLND